MTRLPSESGDRAVELADGSTLIVRPVRPSDADALAALYDELSEDDRYRRFFSAYRPPASFFERLARVADRGGYGVVATVDRPGGPADSSPDGAAQRLVGEASYEILPNGNGELGMAVAADERGWLGPFLLDALAEAAASRGVPNLEADVLVTNRPMLTLLRSRGYATLESSDWSSVRLVVGTGGDVPTWPDRPASGDPSAPRVLVEVPGGRWHADAAAREAGLEVMACSGPTATRRPRCPVLAGRPCPLVAEADAVVVSNAPDDDRWHAVLGAHPTLHPGVPVCVEPRTGPAGRPRFESVSGEGAAVIDEADRGVVVALVDRVAREHRRARDRPRGGAGPSALVGGTPRRESRSMTVDERITELEAQMKDLEEKQAELFAQLAEARLDQWKARLEDLEVQARLGAMEADDRVAALLQTARDRWDDARRQVTGATAAAAGVLESVRERLDEALDDLRRALLDARRQTTNR